MGGMEAYQADFEEVLLNETAVYYQRQAARWITEDSCPDYMIKAEDCLRQVVLFPWSLRVLGLLRFLASISLYQTCLLTRRFAKPVQEEERVINYLHQDSKSKLLKEVETELLAKYENDLLEKEHSGCAVLLHDDKAPPCYAFSLILMVMGETLNHIICFAWALILVRGRSVLVLRCPAGLHFWYKARMLELNCYISCLDHGANNR